MKQEKMKVLLYLKKSGLDKSGKAPIMGRITLGRSIAQFSCKLSCNPDLWNPRESRMDGKSREAVEINGKLENLLLSVQSAYQSLLSKGCLFDAADVKELFQGSVQTRCMLIERLDMLIKEKESHVGIDIKEGAIHGYHSTRIHLQKFIQRKYKVTDLAFSQLTENFIYEFGQYFLGECGFQESTFYNAATHLKTLCRLAYREGLADVLLFDKAKISKGDKRLPKALNKEAELARLMFVFSCFTGMAIADMENLKYKHIQTAADGQMYIRKERQKTKVEFVVPLHPIAEAITSHCRKEQERSEEQQTVKEK